MQNFPAIGEPRTVRARRRGPARPSTALVFGAWVASAPALAQPRPMSSSLELRRGGLGVVPVTFLDEREAFEPWPARLDDGRIIGAEVFRLAYEPSPGDLSPLARWLPERVSWRSMHNETVKPDVPPGVWVLVFDVPADAHGDVRISGETWNVTWFDDVPGPAGRAHDEDRQQAALDRAFAIEAADPRWSWRAAVAGVEDPGPGSREDAVVEAWHTQEKSRWRAALSRLGGIDSSVAAQVRGRLTRVTRFGPGVVAPTWPVGPEVSAIASDLLREDDAQAARAARGFLESTGGVRAWVVDDAGLIDPSGSTPLCSVAIANLGDETLLARPLVRAGGVVAVQPGVVETWTGSAEAPGSGRLPHVSVQTPGERLEFDVGSMWFAVVPPGMTTPAFAEDWTMATWLGGSVIASDVARARVLRASPRVEVTTDSSEPGVVRRERVTPEHWVLYFEASSGEGSDVRVWLGPQGRPTSIVHVTRAGLIDDELTPGRTGEFAGHVTRTETGWSFMLDLPQAERVQIGIEHRDSAGARVAWPRAMFPWQSEPGRIGLDLTRWEE